jgi:endonuclease YncB( thermonuclease family)
MKYLFLLLLLPHTLSAQLVGKVVAIADGDTFTLLADNRQVKVRLHGIDCPEKKQDFGNAAKQYLSGLIFGKEVTVREMGKDRYKRTIGMVTIGGINVNEAMIQAGYAWHYLEYDKNPAWSALEESARRQKKGLWAQPNPTPPWKFRKRRK